MSDGMTGPHPRIRRSFSVIAHSPDVVELRSGVWNPQSCVIRDDTESGKLLRLVAGLDGTVSRRDLARREGVSRADVEAVVDHLLSLGALEVGPSSALDSYLDAVAGAEAAGRPADRDRASRVLLLGSQSLGRQVAALIAGVAGAQVELLDADAPLWRQLASVDVASLDDGLAFAEVVDRFEAWRGAVAVYAEGVIDPLRFRVFNRLALALDIGWIHGALDGPFLLAGPTFLPHRSGCYECFETRVAMNLREGAGYQRYKEALARGSVTAGEAAVTGPLASLLASHLALETLNLLHAGGSFTCNKVLGIYVPAMEIAYHEFLQVPGCPACGSRQERDDSGLYFDARVWLDG